MDIDDLLYEALQLDASEREAWLRRQTGQQPARYTEVKSLLDAYESGGGALERGLILPADLSQIPTRAGERVGAYQIDAFIARGGVGAVYRAHRADGAFEQIVAIKIVPANELQLSLFQAERQILADLNHPAITTIFDAGAMPETQELYLVMEFVDGVNIVAYAQQNNLSKDRRIALMIELLDVVGLAHSRGIIHCDLKPDNILVDKNGQLKLLDFGIASALQPAPGQRHGISPGFSSPQCLAGEPPAIGDDIYSLGKLFGLLLMPSESAGTAQSPVSATGADQCAPGLDPEAGSIYAKACRTEAEHRYADTVEFTTELKNWLSHYPLQSYPGGKSYRIRKHLRRHVIIWLGLALTGSLLFTSGLGWWLKGKAETAEDYSALQIDTVAALAQSAVNELDDKLTLLAGSTRVRLDSAARAIEQLESIHLVQPDNPKINRALVRVHAKVGSLMANPFKLHLAQFNQGRQHIKRAYQLAMQNYGQSANPENLQALIYAENQVNSQLILEGQYQAALRLNLERLEMLEKMDKRSSEIRARIGVTHIKASRLQVQLGELDAAAAGYQKAGAFLVQPDQLSSEFEKERARRRLNLLRQDRAMYALATGRLATAKTRFEDIIERLSGQSLWIDQRRTLNAHQSLACVALLASDDISAAMAHLSRAEQISAQLVRAFPEAATPGWLSARFSSLDSLRTENASSAVWQERFSCDDPKMILYPPGPPTGGWLSVQQQLAFSFVDIIAQRQDKAPTGAKLLNKLELITN